MRTLTTPKPTNMARRILAATEIQHRHDFRFRAKDHIKVGMMDELKRATLDPEALVVEGLSWRTMSRRSPPVQPAAQAIRQQRSLRHPHDHCRSSGPSSWSPWSRNVRRLGRPEPRCCLTQCLMCAQTRKARQRQLCEVCRALDVHTTVARSSRAPLYIATLSSVCSSFQLWHVRGIERPEQHVVAFPCIKKVHPQISQVRLLTCP